MNHRTKNHLPHGVWHHKIPLHIVSNYFTKYVISVQLIEIIYYFIFPNRVYINRGSISVISSSSNKKHTERSKIRQERKMAATLVALVALLPALALGMGLFFYFMFCWDSIIVDFFILYNIINYSLKESRRVLRNICCAEVAEAYLEPSQRSTMELFCENS